MMQTARIWGFVSEKNCSVLSLEQAHHVQLGHGCECVLEPRAWLDLGLTFGLLRGLHPGRITGIQSTEQLARN